MGLTKGCGCMCRISIKVILARGVGDWHIAPLHSVMWCSFICLQPTLDNLEGCLQCCHSHDRCFSKKLNYDGIKIAKTVRIFMEIEHIKNWGVTFWPERIGQLFPTLWSGHEFGCKFWPNLWPLHSMGNSGPILSGQNVTPQFLMCSISIKILTVLAILMPS